MDLNYYKIQIAGVTFELSSLYDLVISENVRPFIVDADVHPSFFCNITVKLAEDTDKRVSLLATDFDSCVYRMENGRIQRFYKSGSQRTIAFQHYLTADTSEAVFLNGEQPKNLNQCFHISGWEKMMIDSGRMILHASFIKSAYGGILFSGFSGVGKSTQADLWVKHRNAKLINGDRTIIYRDKVWKASGSPFAGSSRCFLNEQSDIRVIVMLKQSPNNSIRRLSLPEAFRSIYAGMTVYTWDEGFVNQMLNLVTALVSEIPVFLLSCTPDENAVIALEKVLGEEQKSYE